MPVSSGICQQKMLGAKFVERKVSVFRFRLPECIRNCDLLTQIFSPLKNFAYTAFKVVGQILPAEVL